MCDTRVTTSPFMMAGRMLGQDALQNQDFVILVRALGVSDSASNSH